MLNRISLTETKDTKKDKSVLLLSILIASISLIAYILIKDKGLYVDEWSHVDIIGKLKTLSITPKTFSAAAQLPGYFVTMAIISSLFHISSFQGLRLINVFFALCLTYVFYKMAKITSPEVKNVRTIQFYLFPLLFVFYFLIYTDIFALLLLFLTLYLIMQNKMGLAGMTGLASILVRQNNIIWLGFFISYIFLEKYSLPLTKEKVISFLKNIQTFIISFIVIALFFLINKSPAVGDQSNNPLVFHSANIFLSLFLFFFLFLPLNISQGKTIIQKIKEKPLLGFILPISFIIYATTFKVDNWYNNPTFNYFIRNNIVNWAIENPINQILFFLPIGYSVLSLTVTKLNQKSFYLIYPFTIFFLGLLWNIEPRYYFIPFSLFLLSKKNDSKLVEYCTIGLYVILTGLIFFLTVSKKYFI